MTKKILIFSLITIFIISAATMSFAYGGYGHGGGYGHMGTVNNTQLTEEEMDKLHDEMFELRIADLDKALEAGTITKEEHKLWNDHFEEMEKFHDENGYPEFSGNFRSGCRRF